MILTAAALGGCIGITEISVPGKDDDDIWTGPGLNISESEGPVCYATGFDYPEEYDWKKGGETGSVRCSLVVFADGVPMLKLAAGEGHEVSTDPDMHHLIDGHLYTEFCTEGNTVLRKDGKAFLKYEGRESIRCMVIDEDDTYTLGVPHEGEGFSYRKNGEIILERRSGWIYERLYIDDGRVCFAFCQQVATPDGLSERHYMVRDGRISLVTFPDETSKVWDMMSHQGHTYALTSSGPWNSVEIVSDKDSRLVRLPADAEMVTCRLFAAGDDICIEGMYVHDGKEMSCGIWVEGEEYMIFETGQSISAVCASEDEICCVLNPSDDMAGTIFKSGKIFTMPSRYACTGNTPMALNEGNLYVGLTSVEGSRPMIWKNGRSDTLRLNGPLCTLSISSGE